MNDRLELTKTHTASTAAATGEWIDDRILATQAEGWTLESIGLETDLYRALGYAGVQRIRYTATLVFSKQVES